MLLVLLLRKARHEHELAPAGRTNCATAWRTSRANLAERIAQSSGDLREKVVERLASGFDGVGRRISDDLTRGRQEQLGQLDKAITELQGRFEQLQQATQVKLTEIRGEVEKKLTETVDQNLKNFSAVAEKLTQLHEAAGQMVSLSQERRGTQDDPAVAQGAGRVRRDDARAHAGGAVRGGHGDLRDAVRDWTAASGWTRRSSSSRASGAACASTRSSR